MKEKSCHYLLAERLTFLTRASSSNWVQLNGAKSVADITALKYVFGVWNHAPSQVCQVVIRLAWPVQVRSEPVPSMMSYQAVFKRPRDTSRCKVGLNARLSIEGPGATCKLLGQTKQPLYIM